MPNIKVVGQTVQKLERKQTDGRTDGQTDGRTDGRYQTYYLPCFAVDNNKQFPETTLIEKKPIILYPLHGLCAR